jgi:hypothetical protein
VATPSQKLPCTFLIAEVGSLTVRVIHHHGRARPPASTMITNGGCRTSPITDQAVHRRLRKVLCNLGGPDRQESSCRLYRAEVEGWQHGGVRSGVPRARLRGQGQNPDSQARLKAKFVRRVIAAELSRRVVASDTGTTVLPGVPEAGEVIRTAYGASWITSLYWTISSATMSEALAGAATAVSKVEERHEQGCTAAQGRSIPIVVRR